MAVPFFEGAVTMGDEQVQVSAVRERLSLSGDRLPLNVIPQHPRTTPDTA